MVSQLSGQESKSFLEAHKALQQVAVDPEYVGNPAHAIAAAAIDVIADRYGEEKACEYVLETLRYRFGRAMVEQHATDSYEVLLPDDAEVDS